LVVYLTLKRRSDKPIDAGAAGIAKFEGEVWMADDDGC
jgi:hypothetical protein